MTSLVSFKSHIEQPQTAISVEKWQYFENAYNYRHIVCILLLHKNRIQICDNIRLIHREFSFPEGTSFHWW